MKSKHCEKRTGSSTRKSLSARHKLSSITSAATPIVWLCLITASSESKNGEVTLSYRDRNDGDQTKTLLLDAQEFIRRFLLHVLPEGFMRVRHFGLLANRSKKLALAQCRKLLDLDPALPQPPLLSAKDLLFKITGVDLSRCPCCCEGRMIVVGDLPALSISPRVDSS